MAEVFVSVVSSLVASIERQFSYVSNYKRYVDDLKREVEELKYYKERLQKRVDDAKRNGEGMEGSVEKWLIRADKTVDEAREIVEAKEKEKKPCLKGLCPDLKTRYQLSKQAVRNMKAVAGLLEEGEFKKVSCRTVGKEVRLTSNRGSETLESRMFTLKDILNGLRSPKVNMIGVYGIGGIGKTTLVKEVAKQAKMEKLFDNVVFAWVSSSPNIKKIQEQIADQLDLELHEGTESERARTLCHRLGKEEKVLVILDDIWTSLDLESIGIPFGRVHRGCKMLLTSRNQDVLVHGMHSQYNYCVSVLNQEEAWSLFMKMLGDCIEEHDFQSIAIQIANECGGLPIAIVAVAKALRNKPLFVWEKALEELRSSAGKFKGLDAVVYSCIELSYNYLGNDELKLTILLCSLLNHPYDAPIMDLVKYGIGLGLFEGTYTIQERRDRVYALVHKLEDSCLLLESHTKDSFSMHDIVRNVAMLIALRDQHVFTMRDDVPIGWRAKDILKNCTAISLQNINIRELPLELECPELKVLHLNPKNPFFQIPDNFFSGMTKLTVLVLTKMQLLSLPSSFHFLLNLETLCLDECMLGDIALIGNLKNLEILSFLRSDIEQLPREIGQLTRLKFLDLSNCSKLRTIPANVVSSLLQLEELYMGNTSVEWELEGLSTERSNASLLELKHLSHLTTLEIHIHDAMILPKGLLSKKLERYKIFIGDEWDWSDKYANTRMLKLKLNNTSVCLDEVMMQLKGMEELYLDAVPGIKNVLYDLDVKGFPKLKHLHVQNNPYILCIVDSMAWKDAFPLLESLVLHKLINLEKICHAQLTAQSFSKLRNIKVRNCDKLNNIFTLSIVGGLPQLQTIQLVKCKNMKEIFGTGEEDNVNYSDVDKIEFGQLRSLTLKFLPRLTSFYSQVKILANSQKRCKESTSHTQSSEVILGDELDTPMPFFNEKVVLPNLETLELCAINTEKIWQNQLPAVSSCIQNLTRLIVHGCEKLKYLFPSSLLRSFVQLQHIEICYCTSLEEIVGKETGAQATAMFIFPKVTFLKLWNLPELKTFYPGVHTSEWPLLKRLEVYGCEKVKTFTSELLSFQETSREGRFDIPTQEALFLFEKVINNLEELKLSGKDITMLSQGQFPDHLFRSLKILEIVNDKYEHFPIGLLQRFPNLEKLELKGSSYKEIFSYGEVEKHAGMLTQIKRLKLWELSDLMHIWKQDSKLESVLQNLEMLEVWWCDNLVNLVPPSASFEKLTTLEVWYCKGLKNLVSPSTAKHLVHLVRLRVDGCKLMTEIISNEGDEAKVEIVFSKLKWLSLEHLESLTSFCSSNYTFNFPSLEDLYAIECPKMKIFSCGILSTPKLQEVRQNWGLDKGCWEGDLNTTIQQIHEKKLPTASPTFSLSKATSDNSSSLNLSSCSRSKKTVLKLEVQDDKAQQKAFSIVSKFTGVISISFDMKDKKMTILGDIDAISIVRKLRELCHTELVSIGPAMEAQKEGRI